MNVKIVTIFPQAFPSTLGIGLIGRSLYKIWNLEVIDLKNYGRYLDDKPFGGGAGMILKANILERVIIEKQLKNMIFLSPRGKVFNQQLSKEISSWKDISVICGRYEGIDQRIIEYYKIQEISIGDFILCGAESAALVMIESIIRNLPGVLGNKESLIYESFSNFLLEHNQYTHPRIWKNFEVPSVLLSGNHKYISDYRYQESIFLTKERRPDLFISYFVSRILGIFLLILC